MINFSYMLTDCKDSPLGTCPDFSFSIGDRLITVSDYSEGRTVHMSRDQIIAEISTLLVIVNGSGLNDALEMATNIVYHATDIGLAQFVFNYCEV